MSPKQKRRDTRANEQTRKRDAIHGSTPTQQESSQSTTLAAESTSIDMVSGSSSAPDPTVRPQRSSATQTEPDTKPANRWSYYGSWRTSSKSSPVTESTKESISVQQGTTSESSEARTARRPSQALSRGLKSNRKSIPVTAEPTRVHATSDASDKSRARLGSEEKLKGFDQGADKKVSTSAEGAVDDAPFPPDPIPAKAMSDKSAFGVGDDAHSAGSSETLRPSPPQQQPGGGWFGWWSRPDGYGKSNEAPQKVDDQVKDIAVSLPQPENIKPNVPTRHGEHPAAEPNNETPNTLEIEDVHCGKRSYNASYRSWFGLWSSAQNELATPADQDNKDDERKAALATPKISAPTEFDTVQTTVPNANVNTGDQGKDVGDAVPKSSGWAFWSSERKGDQAGRIDGTQKQVGELAVADTPSQSHPEAAQFNEQRSQANKARESAPNQASSRSRSKKERAKDPPQAEASSSNPPVSQIPSPSITPATEDPPKPVPRGKLPQLRPNLILPTIADTYPPTSYPGYVERMNNYVWSSLRLQSLPRQAHSRHVFRDQQHAPKVKKAIAIGIHGFFPTPLIQKVLGQPTGTSIRFANYAASAVHAWCQDQQPDIKDVEVEKVALEGEGHIADRVTTLWKLLLNWLSHLRQADFILLACHSQGVPVTFMLLSKLIQLGALSPHVRIGVCAMAGINLGPFAEYKSRLFGSAALELFDFSDRESAVSQSYADALDVCLRAGVRVSYIGSLDDQLVSLESALFMPLAHPYVNRAVYVDGRIHAPNFLTHLVIFALKLKNLGVRDHGLIRELSSPLAGSIVGGEGHSRVYDDAAVYRVAVDFALETTDFNPPSQIANPPQTPTASHQHHASATMTSKEAAFARRSHTAGVPASSTAAANSIRRGSFSFPNTTNLPGVAPLIEFQDPPANSNTNNSSTSTNPNPFYLPWAVRGLLSEDIVKQDEKLSCEVKDLVAEFEDWKPISKVMKDVRWRLEGIRSMF